MRMSRKLMGVMVAAAFVASGCANMSEQQKGAAIGAGLGALIGGAADGKKGAAIGAGVGAIGGVIAGNVWSKKMEQQRREMEQATAGTGVDVKRTADNRLKLQVPSDISFDTGRADIKGNFRPILDSFADGLRANPGATVAIIGHTDNTGSDAINDPLSVERAASTRDYLISQGVSASRISIDGRGSREPVASNATAQSRAKNRRVEIFVAEPASNS